MYARWLHTVAAGVKRSLLPRDPGFTARGAVDLCLNDQHAAKLLALHLTATSSTRWGSGQRRERVPLDGKQSLQPRVAKIHSSSPT